MGERAHTPGPWEAEAERICLAMVKRAPDHIRRASEALYEQMLYDVQDYLRDNVEFNLSSELAMAKSRADYAEEKARGLLEALRQARRFIANGIELGFIRMPETQSDPAHQTLPQIDDAIAKASPSPSQEGRDND